MPRRVHDRSLHVMPLMKLKFVRVERLLPPLFVLQTLVMFVMLPLEHVLSLLVQAQKRLENVNVVHPPVSVKLAFVAMQQHQHAAFHCVPTFTVYFPLMM